MGPPSHGDPWRFNARRLHSGPEVVWGAKTGVKLGVQNTPLKWYPPELPISGYFGPGPEQVVQNSNFCFAFWDP